MCLVAHGMLSALVRSFNAATSRSSGVAIGMAIFWENQVMVLMVRSLRVLGIQHW